MSINLTVVVQIIHFILAYILISRIFLRPGYQAVKSDTNRARQLKSNIVALQELIAHKQLYKRTRWELFQDYFMKQQPPLADEVRSLHPSKKKIEHIPVSDYQQLGDDIARKVQKKVFP